MDDDCFGDWRDIEFDVDDLYSVYWDGDFVCYGFYVVEFVGNCVWIGGEVVDEVVVGGGGYCVVCFL